MQERNEAFMAILFLFLFLQHSLPGKFFTAPAITRKDAC
jgi:hypothetical protein